MTIIRISTTSINLDQEDDDINILSNDNEVYPDYILSELYRRVFLYNTKEARKLTKKRSQTLTYKVSQIVLLMILLKNRLSVGATHLPCRILTVVKDAYTLLSQYSPLCGELSLLAP